DRIEYEVVAFTAAQIPRISCRIYPPELCGDLYPEGIPIWPEEVLDSIIREHFVDRCILAYSDLSHQEVMELASKAMAAGADFGFMGLCTMLESTRPVVAVSAVRTGAGKSQTTRYIVDQLKAAGLRSVVVRHPMPYGNLAEGAVQRFASYSDLDSADLTIEEREEYEAHIKRGTLVYAGVDYEAVLRQAEKEADVIVWDGGNNDLPFFKPDLWVTVADALRPGHELTYYPGNINFRAADLIVINKANSAPEESVKAIEANAAMQNPRATVIRAASQVVAEDPELIRDRRVLVIEDGPTLTHGGMPFGAGRVAADTYGARQIIDPRPYAVGSIAEVFSKYQHIENVLPAMGYYPEQIRELQETVNRADCDSVVVATPVDLRRLIEMNKPSTAIRYELADMGRPLLREKVDEFVSGLEKRGLDKRGIERRRLA
ncbi:MAG: cyclic 2,3-diphosphoglycerate synthase, partial [Methanotrichaceae archaeon]|nr:cyclic 2,3-diphosphoglycerate synthase [Methanotrichaceae archaeon]